ncbi:MAG: type II toxin-antitoxin system VapC family toxin [Candidatus Micrarchaeota archaeon]|nr:type II toxin-antitoxin system VapC family toxin [Candidatus Micrarchaeota archaeon]
MAQIVLDASVIAKLFLKEEGSDTAIRLKDGHVEGKIEILAPSLMKYELISALKSKHFSKNEIKLASEVVRDYGFSVIELDDQLFDRVAELSIDYNISAYDASYLALAEEAAALLCTADEKLLSKAKKLPFVKPLSAF